MNRESTKRRIFSFLVLGLLISVISGCGPAGENDRRGSGGNAKKIIINGGGATFPSPVYSNWTYLYSESTSERVLVNYQGVGSGAGINQLKEGTLDFAGSDAPLSTAELKEANWSQFPMLAGGLVVIVNVPGLNESSLRLSQRALADIYLGRIKKWNDPILTSANPGLALPDLEITVVHRSDGSGTTFLFTDYLSKISTDWKEQVGAGKSVNWPVGIGGQKNPGVCSNVKKVLGSIGYTEYTYAVEMRLSMAVLENAAGKYIAPNETSFRKSMETADWDEKKDFYVILTNSAGEECYPILGITYILYSKKLAPDRKKELDRYFNWCFESGKSSVAKMHYIPIPEKTISQIRNAGKAIETGPTEETDPTGEKEIIR